MSDFYGTIAHILTLVSVFYMVVAIISLFGSIRGLRLEILYLRKQVESTQSSLSDISFGINLLSVDMEKMKRLRVSEFVTVNYKGFSLVVNKGSICLVFDSGTGMCYCSSIAGLIKDISLATNGTHRSPHEMVEDDAITKEEYDRIFKILCVDDE